MYWLILRKNKSPNASYTISIVSVYKIGARLKILFKMFLKIFKTCNYKEMDNKQNNSFHFIKYY